MPSLTTAVIGCGKMGTYHARILARLKNVKLEALWTKSQKNVVAKAKEFNLPVYTDLDRLLSQHQLDFVVIATPTPTHKEMTIKFLKAGCHVLVEKPMAATAKDAQEMAKIAKKMNKKLMVGQIERFNPVALKAKKLIDQGKIGSILFYSAARGGPKPPNPGSDVFLDLGIHDLDLFPFLTGEKFTPHQKITTAIQPDLAIVTAQTAKGTLFHLQTDWLRSQPARETDIIGQKGQLHLDFLNKKLSYTPKGQEPKIIKINPQVNQLELEIKAFIRSLRQNTPSPIPASEAIEVLKFYESLQK